MSNHKNDEVLSILTSTNEDNKRTVRDWSSLRWGSRVWKWFQIGEKPNVRNRNDSSWNWLWGRFSNWCRTILISLFNLRVRSRAPSSQYKFETPIEQVWKDHREAAECHRQVRKAVREIIKPGIKIEELW